MRALDALDVAETAELLITRVNYPSGKPNGVALALMARNRWPGIRVVFTARADMQPYTVGIGDILAVPVAMADLIALVSRLLPLPVRSLGIGPALPTGKPILQSAASDAPDRLDEFSWSTRRLLQLAATAVARAQRVHDHSLQLQLAAIRRSELAGSFRPE
jgi:hypothetical protein